jgi:hypothetical protein
VPEDITDAKRGAETIKLILRNLAALTQYLAELRGLYGSGHGRDGRHRGLQPRHARLSGRRCPSSTSSPKPSVSDNCANLPQTALSPL